MTSPNTESDKSIDTILKKAWEHGYYSNNYPSNPNMTWFSDDKQALYSLLMDVIGSAELEEVSGEQIPEAWIRNQFRLHQIVKLNKLFNKEETSK